MDDHVFRGAQPDDAGIQALAKQGVHTILDLRNSEERSEREEKLAESLGLKYISLPLSGYSAPSNTQVSKALAALNDQKEWPVFVHCKRGADRTGTVIACYRISHDGWTNRQALDEAKGLGMSSMEIGMKHYILGFPRAVLEAAPKPMEPAGSSAK